MQHWKQHKSECTKIKEQYEDWKEQMNNVLPDNTALDTKEGPCAICLEETITNPVVLPCGHAFCFACVGGYQCSTTSKEGASCPYCRGEIPDVAERAAERAVLYGKRAHVSSKDSEEQKNYAKLAVAELESLIDLASIEDKNVHTNQMSMLYSKVSLISLTDQSEQTIAVAKELLLLNAKHPGRLGFDQVEFTKCAQVEAYASLGKWKEAEKIYKPWYNSYLKRGKHNVLVVIGLARTKYELGKYDEAIEIGSVGIKGSRHWPGVHKYVALSHKAIGNIDEAKKIMSRAILYEEHWDKDNMQKNKELLQELNNM